MTIPTQGDDMAQRTLRITVVTDYPSDVLAGIVIDATVSALSLAVIPV